MNRAASSRDAATEYNANATTHHDDDHLSTLSSDFLNRKSQPGRKGDPRMNRAVAAKLENPNISRLEALQKGGFVFEGDTGPKAPDWLVFDPNGVTLKQRKNQLNRRIRRLRQSQGKRSPPNASSSPSSTQGSNPPLSHQLDEMTAPALPDIKTTRFDVKATPRSSSGDGSSSSKGKGVAGCSGGLALSEGQVQVLEQSGGKTRNRSNGHDFDNKSSISTSPVNPRPAQTSTSTTSDLFSDPLLDAQHELAPEPLGPQAPELANRTHATSTEQSLTSEMSSPSAQELDNIADGNANKKLSFSSMNQTGSVGFVGKSQADPELWSSTIRTDERHVLEALGCALSLTQQIWKNHELLDHSSRDNVERVASDLFTLGSFLYSRFSGVAPSDEKGASADPGFSDGLQRKKGRRRQSAPRSSTSLRGMGFPVSLCILVSSLMDAKDTTAAERYESAKEVEKDLQLMISDPCRYLFDDTAARLSGKLEFPKGRLYGREEETSRLVCILNRVVVSCGSPELVLVQGYSGTGKSALVEHIQQPLYKKKGHFILGKFSELRQTQPMIVIFDAFNEYCINIVNGDSDTLALIRHEVKEALGSDANVLMGLIPNLSKLTGSLPASPDLNAGGREALNRLLYYFSRFVRAIASPSHPVVLFFDDLQWADQASLDLIFALLCNTQLRSLLLVGCYRNNVVDDDHPLTKFVGNAIKAGVATSNIRLGNIERENVNALISDTLHLSPRLTTSLARIVHSKTNGNPLFVVQFLRSLCEERLLHFSASSHRWEWDLDGIQAKDIADNVVDLMSHKMLRLDSGVQQLLKAAACLGSQSEVSTLQLLLPDGTADSIQVLIDEGLMSKVGTCYKFSHDQIRQAAYSLIPANDRNAIHLQMGMLLQERASAQELLDIIFVVVDQLQRGSDLIHDHAEKVKVAKLFLLAGEKAMSSYAFLPASIYLLRGSLLLEACDWKMYYDLCLRLFSSCAEVQYVLANYDGVMVTSNQVFTHARCLQDKLRCIFAVLESNGCKGNYHDAVAFGLDTLAQFGVHFPSNVTRKEILEDLAKTKNLLEGCSFDSLLAKGRMKEPANVAAMELLRCLSRWSFLRDQKLSPLISFRMIQLTLQFGVCDESSFAFAALGSFFAGFCNLQEARYYGKLALSLLEHSKSNYHLARVYCVVNVHINIFTEPVQASLPQLRHGYEVGMSMGDTVWGLACARAISLLAFQCGRKLQPLAEEIKVYVQQMRTYKTHIVMVTLPILQAILNLIDDAGDPIELTGECMTQHGLIQQALEKQHHHVVIQVVYMRMRLAYLFGKHKIAADLAERLEKNSKTEPFRSLKQADQAFYSGLVAIAMARCGEQGEWRSIACESMEKMKVWVATSNWNFQHKLDLLNAEMAYLNGDSIEVAADFYDDSIRNAKKHGFIHEQALACERAGIMFAEVLGPSYAADYFQRAHEYYLEWGANRKAAEVFLRLQSLSPDERGEACAFRTLDLGVTHVRT